MRSACSWHRFRRTLVLALAAAAVGCAGGPTPGGPSTKASRTPEATVTATRAAPAPSAKRRAPSAGQVAAQTALSMIGTPYRFGGSTPSGFDCSGLVVYSFGKAGVADLPRSAANLERATKPISLDRLEPGDLLFFRLSGKKTSHVGLYVGKRSFVHAPSPGKRVERVSFDHVYWGPKIRVAGRL